MLTLGHRFDEPLTAPAGTYLPRVYGRLQDDGMWGGWLIFFPVHGGRVIATDRETMQSSLEGLSHWASGLTPVYLDGALGRALARQPEAQLARELERLERAEASAAVRAEALEAEASAARAESRLAEAARQRTEERLLAEIADTATTEAEAHEQQAAAADAAAETASRALRARKHKKSSGT